MADLRDKLRPLVDNPTSGPLPLADIAARAERRRARRRSARVAVGTLSALAVLGLISWWPISDGPDTVTDVDPAAGGEGTMPVPEGSTTTSERATGSEDDQQTAPPSTDERATDTSDTADTTDTTDSDDSAETSPSTGTSDPADHDSGPVGSIQAEDHDEAAGVEVDGPAVMVQDGGHLVFHDLDLQEPATRLEVNMASGAGAGGSGTIEVRLHRVDNVPIATIAVSDTGGWDSFVTIDAATTAAIEGQYDVYVTFTSSQSGDLALVDWFRFVA